jgi:hypothetical protein
MPARPYFGGVPIKLPMMPGSWSRCDYALAAAFAASFLAFAPALAAPPFLIAMFLPPKG